MPELTVDVFARLVRDRRIEQNLTQEQLAERLGATVKRVGSWERGGAPAYLTERDVEVKIALSRWLEVPVETLPVPYARQSELHDGHAPSTDLANLVHLNSGNIAVLLNFVGENQARLDQLVDELSGLRARIDDLEQRLQEQSPQP